MGKLDEKEGEGDTFGSIWTLKIDHWSVAPNVHVYVGTTTPQGWLIKTDICYALGIVE